MSTEFKLPELGENIETIQVTRVLVAAGDSIAADQPLLEVETDKATIEVPADAAGTVESVLVSDGDEVAVGQVMLTFSDSAAPTPEPEPAPEPEAAPTPPTSDLLPPTPPTPPTPPPPDLRPTASDLQPPPPSIARRATEGLPTTSLPPRPCAALHAR